jgi:3-ketosteroid 9alpha-monooxygenase subunit A
VAPGADGFRFPWGWFVVAFSDDLGASAVQPLRYFATDLVLFRTAAGEARILDAHCPHLGAHLGHGGVVDGDAIRCPFHAWTFDGRGRCVAVPYASKIPPRAAVRCWPVREQNGLIFVWHHPDRLPPSYDIPLIPEHGDPAWLPWDHSAMEIATQPREIVENVADRGHFVPVHGTHVERFQNHYEDHRATQISEGVAYPLGGGEERFRIEATYHGPAYQASRMQGAVESLLINAHTPIDASRLCLRFAVSLRIGRDRERATRFARQYVDNLRQGFLQDVRIWEHKVYRPRPVLCDGDGPIGQLRRWYRQFYVAASGEADEPLPTSPGDARSMA